MDESNEISMQERLHLIESMIHEGRRSTDYWGWMFILWGVAYLIAIGWAYFLPHPQYSWPVVMTLALLVSAGVSAWKRKRHSKPETTQSRALAGIWCSIAAAISLFVFAGSASGHFEFHMFLAGIEILIGAAHAASAFTLRWRPQFFIALVWWICGVVSYYVAIDHLIPVLIVGTLIGNIGFGLYLMRRESTDRRLQVSHA